MSIKNGKDAAPIVCHLIHLISLLSLTNISFRCIFLDSHSDPQLPKQRIQFFCLVHRRFPSILF